MSRVVPGQFDDADSSDRWAVGVRGRRAPPPPRSPGGR